MVRGEWKGFRVVVLEGMGAPRPAFCKPEPRAPETVLVSGGISPFLGEAAALVGGIENSKFTLENFDFAPNIAPTHDQKYPHLVTHTVFVWPG